MISIVLPVKNAGLYLEECLDSIISQTYSDWQLIAVNDHSSDDSSSILNSYAGKDTRISVIENKGKGIIPALQTAYEKAQGIYITRIDADDKMSETKLEVFSKALAERQKGTVAVGLVEYFAEKGISDGYRRYADWLNQLTLEKRNFQDIYKECSIPSPNWMMHRKDFEECGAFNSEIYPEDYDLAFRMRAADLDILPIPHVTHYWRDHTERSSRNDPNYQDNRFTQLKVRYFKQYDYDSSVELFLWGAGKKGKNLAQELQKNAIPFRWICNNEKKIGHEIYGVTLEDTTTLNNDIACQVILAVSQQSESEELKQNLADNRLVKPYFFC